MRFALKFVLAGAMIVAWTAFIALDRCWNACLAHAVADGGNSYGEIYGPLTFFRPLALYTAFGLSAACGLWLVCTAKAEKQ